MAHAIEPTFPLELLKAPKQSRIDYFAQKSIAHDAIVDACELAKDNIDFGTAGQIIPIVGPSGVGTTKLAYKLWHLYERMGQAEFGQTATQNVRFSIGVHAPSQNGKIGRNYWKCLLKRILKGGGDILIDNKICAPSSEFILTQPTPWGDPSGYDLETLLTCVVTMLQMRKTKVLFINQADRMFPDGDPGSCAMSQHMLTDLAAMTQTRIVLIGNYGLVRESARGLDWFHRQLVVHFRRYDKRDEGEFSSFVTSIEDLLAAMVLPNSQRMKKIELADAEQIYNRCIGCFGKSKSTFEMAYSHALHTGEKITTELLMRFMPPVRSAKKIAIDAMEGEQILLDEDETSLSKLLRYGLATGAEAQASKAPASVTKTAKSAAGSKKTRIGERKPTRDPVGAVYAQRA